MKLLSWNIASIRKFKNFDYIIKNNFDIICLQEIRYNNINDLQSNYNINNYYSYWSLSKKLGYSGCVTYTKYKPINNIIDEDGRYIILEFEHYFIVNVYVMNSGEKLQRLDKRLEWDKEFNNVLLSVCKNKELIIIGDLNCAHESIDVKNPETKLKKPGYTIEERLSFSNLLSQHNLIDIFRHIYPNVIKYSYYSYRSNIKSRHNGWRLDYILTRNSLIDKIIDIDIKENIFGSDHVPLICEINIFI
jgi:exodeoxyribonuclease-3